MTDTGSGSKATRTARRATRLDALQWLWRKDASDDAGRRYNSSLGRVRACRLHASDADAGVSLRVQPDGSARWAGLQSCGSTWACPVCADRIQAARKDEVAAMIDAAHGLGMIAAFVTFTVRHNRTQSLREVWDEVADAWRKTMSGGSGAAQRAVKAERAEFGIAGYVRLWETTHGGDAGWHVHVHALLFLDPAGIVKIARESVPLLRTVRADLVGPLPEHTVRVAADADRVSLIRGTYRHADDVPRLPGQQVARDRLTVTAAMPRVRHGVHDADAWATATAGTVYGPLPKGTRRAPGPRTAAVVALDGLADAWRRPEGPLPAPVLVADARGCTRTGPETSVRVPCGRAWDNLKADLVAGKALRRSVRPGLYRRDVVDLGRRMFARWRAALPASMAPPEVCRDRGHDCTERRRREDGDHSHGWDARIVSDVDQLAEYFTKNVLSVKGVESAALEVTSSSTKRGRVGNRTPFGILADLVAGDYHTDEDRRRDHRLWWEWESVSKGRRQIRPSDGLRDLLGLGPEVSDDDLVADLEPAPTAGDPLELAALPPATYRRVALAGDAGWLMELAEAGDYEVLYQVLRVHGHDPAESDVGPVREFAPWSYADRLCPST